MSRLDKVLGGTLASAHELDRETAKLVPDSGLQREILMNLIDIKYLLRQIHKVSIDIRYNK